MVIAALVGIFSPILFAEGYTGEIPAAWLPIVTGITAGISMLIRWYRDKYPVKAEAMNL